MNMTMLGEVPLPCRRRLTAHYGPAVDPWLASAAGLLNAAADRWQITLTGYLDAGCASVLAIGQTRDERPVVVKAWYDRSRYAHEIRALRLWPQDRVPRVLANADDLTVAVVETVGGRSGGAPRPDGEYEAVALALAGLHDHTADVSAFPTLDDYLWAVVLPRIQRRLTQFGGDLPAHVLDHLGELDLDPRGVLLHGDLYRQNVLFDNDRRPVFIDPLPMVGDPAFDWAFWVVYYDLLADPVARLRLAAAIGRIAVTDLLPFCLTLCIDGLLYYRETRDPRASRMLDVITTISEQMSQGATW
jgi:streptomycin 6-kinase